MFEPLKDLPQGIDGLKAVGIVSRDDYERSVQPLIDEARRTGRRASAAWFGTFNSRVTIIRRSSGSHWRWTERWRALPPALANTS